MPKIRIREADLTTNEQAEIKNTIFMLDTKATGDAPTIIKTADEAASLANKEIIENIIKLGGQVVVAKAYNTAKDYLKDRNQFDIKFLLAKEGTNGSEATDLTSAIEVAKARRDCCVVYTKTTSKFATAEETALKAAVTDATGTQDEFLSTEKGAVGKYVLAFYGKTLTYGETPTALDAGLGYVLAYLQAAKTNPEWLAVAGSKRGYIPLANIDCGFMTESDIDDIQPADCKKISCNPIVKMNPWGVRIWGNRTCFSDVNGTGLVASSFANLRVLICDIKKALYKSARKYQFEQNTDVLWVNFQSSINTLLEEMVQSYGIAGYRWFREETNDRAKLKATLQIVPVEPVEDFDLTLELVDSLEVTE